MPLTMLQHGHHGRLCNQFFQYASLYAIAKKNGTTLELPKWNFAKYFTSTFPEYTSIPKINRNIEEPSFHYTPEFYAGLPLQNRTINIRGYFQSEKYFEEYQDEIKNIFTFKPEFIEEVKNKMQLPEGRKNIVIQIRMTDYVLNENYYQLPITFYLTALLEHFPDYEDCNIILVSDDIPYCKVHFECLPNVYYIDKLSTDEDESAIEQVCLMSLCDGFIIANGTFGWWGAWLAEKQREVKVVHSPELFSGPLFKNNGVAKDFYPERWITHDKYKIDLTDCTFTIPVFYDHPDRKQNLDLSVCLIQRYFDTNVIIGEQGSSSFMYMEQWCKYVHFDYKEFHRTKMLNEMARFSQTPIIANWDCDVIIPPLQIYLCVKAITEGADMVYPYGGKFVRIDRNQWFKRLEKHLDCGIITVGWKPEKSVGGAVFFNKESFIEGGMENERMIAFAPEDKERYERFTRLGYHVHRIEGPLFHIDHHTGPTSNTRNPFWRPAMNYMAEIEAMNDEQLKAHVAEFEWA